MKQFGKKYLYLLIIGLIFLVILEIPIITNSNANFSVKHNSGSSFEPRCAETSLKIMTTNTIPYDIVSNVVGNPEAVESIIDGETDIHHFQGPTQEQINSLSEADVLFAMGLEDLEPWLDDTLDALGSNAPPVVNLVQSAMIRNDSVLDNTPNPHVWLDPSIIKQMADIVYSDLSGRDPSNAAVFLVNKGVYHADLDALLVRIEGAKPELENVKVVTIHPAFSYLFDLLEMDQIATLEKVEGQEPSNAYYQEVIDLMKEEDCELVIGQPQIPEEEVFELAREAGAKVSLLTPFPFVEDQDGNTIENYIAMMDYNLWALQHPEDPSEDEIASFEVSLISVAIFVGIASILIKNRRKLVENA